MQDDVRWVQRFQNLTKAYRFLKAALDLIRHQYAPQFERLVDELSQKSAHHG